MSHAAVERDVQRDTPIQLLRNLWTSPHLAAFLHDPKVWHTLRCLSRPVLLKGHRPREEPSYPLSSEEPHKFMPQEESQAVDHSSLMTGA